MAGKPHANAYAALFPVLLSVIFLSQIVNITHIDGLKDDFSNLVMQVTAGNSTYAAPYTIVDKSDGQWALVNVTVPEDNYTLAAGISVDTISSNLSPGMFEVHYFDGLAPDFSNLDTSLDDGSGAPVLVGHSIVAMKESQWAVVALEREPYANETISFGFHMAEGVEPINSTSGNEAAPIDLNQSSGNETLPITAPINETLPVNETLPINETLPNINDSLNATFPGNYSIIMKNETNGTVSIYADLGAGLALPDGSSIPGVFEIKDMPRSWGGAKLNSTFNIRGSKDGSFPANITLARGGSSKVFEIKGKSSGLVPKGTYDVTIRPSKEIPKKASGDALPPPVEQVQLSGVDISGGFDLGLEYLSLNSTPFGKTARQAFAIDPSKVNFTNGTITIIPEGSELYKCKDWDFSKRECDGQWALLRDDMVPGQEYTFELTPEDPGFVEILTTNAEHLDENRTFISDIYDSVKELDGNWSEAIPDGHYVRVTFERNLTDGNDITLYARSADNNPAGIEVYAENSSELVTKFENVSDANWYKVYLTNLQGSQETFDLKVLGSVEFDYITDPSSISNVSAEPDPQGFGLNVTIFANVTNASAVLVGITAPGGNEINHTMTNTSGLYAFNYSSWTNGTYFYRIYANDTGGAWISSSLYNFTLFQNLSIQEKTLQDYYMANQTINITDPEFINLDAPKLTETSFGNGWMPPQTDDIQQLKAASNAFASASSKGLPISARVQDQYGVRRVDAIIPTLNGDERVPLSLVKGTANDGVWQATWVPHDLVGKHFIVMIEAENAKHINETGYVSVGDPPGKWILPSSDSDPTGLWSNRFNARDGDTHTYAEDNSDPGSGWGSYIYFNVSKIQSDRVRVWADYDVQVSAVDIDINNGTTWNNVYEGPISNLAWSEINFSATNVTAGRFRYQYNTGGWIYWLYEFQFYNLTTFVNYPVVASRFATSVEETTAILHGTVLSDGGDTCQVRFLYGNVSGAYTNSTPWVQNMFTDSLLGEMIHGLNDGQTYYFRAQIINSAGPTNSSELFFTTGTPLAGWLTPTGYQDPDSRWDNGQYAFDDEVSSEASSYHKANDVNGVWSSYLYLNRTPSIMSRRIRFNAKATDVDMAEVSVFANGSWVTVYNASFTDSAWTETSFNYSNVSQARIRFRAIANNRGFEFRLAEFDFFKSPITAVENQSKLENRGPTNASCFLFMKTQFWNGSAWLDDDVVVNETTPRILGVTDFLKLDSIWNPNNYSTNNLSFGTGVYRIYAACRDNQSNVLMDINGSFVNSTYNFTYDTSAPKVSITSPLNGSNYSIFHMVPIRANVTDDYNVSTVLANVSSDIGYETVILVYNSTSGLWEYDYWNTVYVSVYTIRIIANDTAGNVNNTEFVQVNLIDTSPSSVSLISPANGFTNNTVTLMNVTFSCNATDDFNIKNITLFMTNAYNSSFGWNASKPVSGVHSNASFNLTLPLGFYSWTCQACDDSDLCAWAPANWSLSIGGCPVISSPIVYNQTFNYVGAPNDASPLGGYACVKITSSNVVFDCNGHSIHGNGTSGLTYGILENGSLKNITLRNCPDVSGYSSGFYIYNSTNGTVSNSTARGNNVSGFSLDSSSGINMTTNLAENNSVGFSLSSTAVCILSGNNATLNNGTGFSLISASTGNTLSNDLAGFNRDAGFSLSSGSDRNLLRNDSAFSNGGASSASGFYLGSVLFTNLSGNSAYNNTQHGFFIQSSNSSYIYNNSAWNNSFDGIQLLFDSINDTLRLNDAHGNGQNGIWLDARSSRNNLTGNTVRGNVGSGIMLADLSDDNILEGNVAYNNSEGISLTKSFTLSLGVQNNTISGGLIYNNTGDGIYLQEAVNAAIQGVNISGNQYGIYQVNSTNISLSGDNVTDNTNDGIRLDALSNGSSLASNFICFNGFDMDNLGASNTGSLDRCDSFLGWSENGHPGCEYSCSSMWHRFFGNVSGNIVLRANDSSNLVYSWNASGFNIYFVDSDSDIHWENLQAIGRNAIGGPSSNDFIELDNAFHTANYSDNINATYSTDGSTPKQTDSFTVYGSPISNVPVANSTAFNTTFRTGILWDMSNGTEYSNTYNQSTVWVVKVNTSTPDVYGTYDYLGQIPYTLSSYEGNTTTISLYAEFH